MECVELHQKLGELSENQEINDRDRVEIYRAYEHLSPSDKIVITNEFSSLIKEICEKDSDSARRVFDIIENA